MLVLGLLKMDLLCAEDSVVGSSTYLTYVGRAACNVIRAIIIDAVSDYDYNLNFEKYTSLCEGKCPDSILKNISELRDIGYEEKVSSLPLDLLRSIHKDIISWFENRCKSLGISDVNEIEGVEELYYNMR